MRAVVVAHGDVDAADAAHVRDADLVIAADGGAAHLAAWGIEPGVIVGDFDSVGPELSDLFRSARWERWPAEKDKTDTELAIDRAIESGAREVVVVGALGGPRADHAIANVLLLGRERPGVDLRLVRGPLSLSVLRGGGRSALRGEAGELVTLLAIGGDAHEVRTDGLRYPLAGETLALGSSRGVSNEIARRGASVSLGSGTLLIVEGGRLGAGAEPQSEP